MAATRIRGVSLALRPQDLEEVWIHSRGWWEAYFAGLARSRFNRLKLAFAEPVVFGDKARGDLGMISSVAGEYAVELALSIYPAAVPGGAADMHSLLAACPSVRSVELRMAAGEANRRDSLVRAVAGAGRRVVLEVPGAEVTPGLTGEVVDSGVPWRITAPYAGKAPQPVAGVEEVVWELADRPAWNEAAAVRQFAQEMAQAGATGFEIDAGTPGTAESGAEIYSVLGKLSYSPKPLVLPPAPKPVKKK